MSTPKVSCLCPTYEPRDSLMDAIQCFLNQEYQNRELIILDDWKRHGWSHAIEKERVIYLWSPRRFRTLPEKYNALVGLSRGEILIPWEDDDLYATWHISTHAAAIEDAWLTRISKPTVCEQQMPDGKTYRRRDVDNHRFRRFHASIAYTRSAFESVGGYPITARADFDQQFMAKLQKWTTLVDPIDVDPRPSYTNRWRQSSQGNDDVAWYDNV